MERMALDSTLRERVARALWALDDQHLGVKRTFQLSAYLVDADAALAALGLDDDTAVYRLAGWLSTLEPYRHIHPENLVGRARSGLEAALTAAEDRDG